MPEFILWATVAYRQLNDFLEELLEIQSVSANPLLLSYIVLGGTFTEDK